VRVSVAQVFFKKEHLRDPDVNFYGILMEFHPRPSQMTNFEKSSFPGEF
jgi:hypothetical protein